MICPRSTLLFLKSWYELYPTHIFVQLLTDKALRTVLPLSLPPVLKDPEQSLGMIASSQRAYMLIEYDATWSFVQLNEQGRIVVAESNKHMQGFIIKNS